MFGQDASRGTVLTGWPKVVGKTDTAHAIGPTTTTKMGRSPVEPNNNAVVTRLRGWSIGSGIVFDRNQKTTNRQRDGYGPPRVGFSVFTNPKRPAKVANATIIVVLLRQQ